MFDEQNNLILIDFGFTKQYMVEATIKSPQTHIPPKDHVPFIGNLLFSSINTHLFKEQSRRDDLEALAYLLFYIASGRKMPWKISEDLS